MPTHTHINSSAGAPLNATKIAVMKVSHLGVTVIGPELVLLIYKMLFFVGFFARSKDSEWLRAESIVAQPTIL